MSSGCGDVLSLADLQTAKKHQIFEAEVITGKSGGVATGADIDYAINQVTGQSQKTLPAILRDVGFEPASFNFTTGGTLTIADQNKVVYDPISMTWYGYTGTLPVVVPAGFNPAGAANWKPMAGVNYKLNFPAEVAGAVYRTEHDKLDDFVSLKDFGAAGDGVTNDSAAFTYAENYVKSSRNILTLTNGDYNLEDIPATPTGGFGNDIKALYVRSNKPSVLGVVEGSTSAPSRTIDPSLWVQKTVRKDNPGDPYAHNIGAVYGGVVAKGDGMNVTNGTWMSGVFNCKLDGTLLPSGVSDVRGNAIGLAGFAESVKPSAGHVTCGVWAVGSSPTLTAEEFSNFSGNFSTVGAEINLNINHPQAALGDGKGESAGLLINNYRKGSDYPSDPTLRDISIGVWLNGTDINGTYDSNNVDIYNGYQTGIRVDKIKFYGIEFGKYMANGAIGIKFPNSYAGMEHRMDTGIALGDHKINLGEYTGANFFDSDLWLNAGNLYLKTNGSTRTMLGTTGVSTNTSNTTTHTIRVNIGGVLYDILARQV